MSGTQYHIPLRRAMSTDVVIMDGLTTVADALEMMRARDISSMVVERRNELDEYGLVLVSDIAREVVLGNRRPARTHLYEVMLKPAPTLDAEMGVKYAIRLMQRLGLTHVLVVEGRRLVGIATLRDLVMRHLAKETPPET